MRAVNLLPRDEPARSFQAKRGVVFLGGGGAALVTVALASLLIGASSVSKQQRQSLDLLNAQLLAVPKPKAEQSDTQDDAALVAEKTARIAALSTALGGRIAWDGVLRQISQVLPGDVWLTSLTASEPVAGAGGVGPQLTFNGSTYSQDGVARFLSRVSVLPALENVQLQSSAVDAASGSRIVRFVLLADVRAAGTGPRS